MHLQQAGDIFDRRKSIESLQSPFAINQKVFRNVEGSRRVVSLTDEDYFPLGEGWRRRFAQQHLPRRPTSRTKDHGLPN